MREWKIGRKREREKENKPAPYFAAGKECLRVRERERESSQPFTCALILPLASVSQPVERTAYKLDLLMCSKRGEGLAI